MSYQPREMTPDELRLVNALLEKAQPEFQFRTDLEAELVRDVDDGGMGGLAFENGGPVYGRTVAELVLKDVDGVPVLASLYVDENEQLYELDMFKGDFSKLQKIADSFVDFESQ